MPGPANHEKFAVLQEFANRVVQYFTTEGNFSKIKTVNHFKIEKANCSTRVYKILKRYEERGTAAYRKPTGRARTQATPENLKKMRELLKEDPTMSLMELSQELGIPKETVCRMRTKDLGLRKVDGLVVRKWEVPQSTKSVEKVRGREEEEEENQSIQQILEVHKEEYLLVPPGVLGHTKKLQTQGLEGTGANEAVDEEPDQVWDDLDEFVEDAPPSPSQTGFSPGGTGTSSTANNEDFPVDKGKYKVKVKDTLKNYETPPISKTCILCRGKLVKQLKINSMETGSKDDASTSSIGCWKALCLESLSMLFGLSANHPLITVFANSITTSNGSRGRGKLCNQCLQNASNVHFIFWQIQSLEKKLSELQTLIYDRLRFNYEQLPDDLIFRRFIDAEDLKNDLESLNYDDIVKIIYEEIKCNKINWPKPSHTTRWTEAYNSSKQIAGQFLQTQKDEEEQDIRNDGEEPNPCSLDDDAYDDASSPPPSKPFPFSSPPSPSPSHLPVKIEVDPSKENMNSDGDGLDSDQLLEGGDHPVMNQLKRESNDDKDDDEWTIIKNSKSSKLPKPKRKRKIVRKVPAIKTKKVYKRVPCTEDPSECNKTFWSRKLMLDHVEKHHKTKKFSCDYAGCSQKFTSEDNLNHHRELLHGILRPKIICELCGVEVDPDLGIGEHNYRTHRGNGNYKCDRCSMDFGNIQEFESHQKLHQESPLFSCVLCSLESEDLQLQHLPQPFTNWSDLQSHVQTNHLSNGMKCNICGIRKPNEELLSRHLKLHEKPKSFMCSECGKAFSTPRHLKTHDKVCHSNSSRKSYCNVCGKQFKLDKYMRRHRLSSHPEYNR